MSQTRNVAILIFDDVEVLDFAGPLEAFSVVGKKADDKPFHVFTVAETLKPVQTANGLSVNPAHTLADCPRPDILLVPGGYGTRREMNNPVIVEWIKTLFPDLELLLSVCTGSLILAQAGLLDGLNSTTHFSAYDLLKELAPTTTVCPGARFLDNGKIIVSAGVSAGIDMSFHIIARLLGDDVAQEAAHYIEYEYWQPG